MPIENDGIMIILSSPSGAGKTTLVSLLSKLDNFEISDSEAEKILTVGDAIKFIESKASK